MRLPRFLPLFFAVPILAIAILFALGKRQEVSGFLEIKGRVVEVSTTSCGNNGRHTCWRPTIEYSLDGNTKRTLRSTDRLSSEPSLGSELDLLVNPDDPDDVRIDSVDGQWEASLVLGFLAGMFFLISVAYSVIPTKYMARRT